MRDRFSRSCSAFFRSASSSSSSAPAAQSPHWPSSAARRVRVAVAHAAEPPAGHRNWRAVRSRSRGARSGPRRLVRRNRLNRRAALDATSFAAAAAAAATQPPSGLCKLPPAPRLAAEQVTMSPFCRSKPSVADLIGPAGACRHCSPRGTLAAVLAESNNAANYFIQV